MASVLQRLEYGRITRSSLRASVAVVGMHVVSQPATNVAAIVPTTRSSARMPVRLSPGRRARRGDRVTVRLPQSQRSFGNGIYPHRVPRDDKRSLPHGA